MVRTYVYFHTKNNNVKNYLEGLGVETFVIHLRSFGIHLRSFGIVCGHLVFCGLLVYFPAFWYVAQRKSGNSGFCTFEHSTKGWLVIFTQHAYTYLLCTYICIWKEVNSVIQFKC
jgi:hypothetical protein